ncbi:MAG: serine/threonine protein kinase [Myxococcaceae bacterium]|nr:serine/threonine protein kinase [Myxococcaceae bacterium]
MSNVPPKLGPFEPLHRLGAGGMAETFLAVRRGPAGFEQRVCIKRILPAYESDKEFVESFLEEARTSAALRHANIVQVVDFGMNESDGSHYLALELVDGPDLRALMQREGTFDPEVVTLIAADLAAALAHAHAADEGHPSVVHRDLSPSNVLVSRAGEVKLTDFGIARVIGGAHRTASGVIKGKVPYMPPEYVDGGRFDTQGDLFSLGVMLYELCHGHRPFDGDSELDTMRRIAAGDRRPFEVYAPPAFIMCIDRLLRLRPEDRFADALALLDALPPISVHQTRKRLAGLVRGRPSGEPSALFTLGSTPAQAVRTVALLPTERSPSAPTRTAPRPASKRPSRGALYVLAVAVALLGVVLVTALLRDQLPLAMSAPPLSVPSLPAPDPAAEVKTAEGPELSPAEVASAALPRGDARHAPEPAGPQLELERNPVLPEPEPEPVLPEPVRHHAHASAARQSAELRVVVYPFGDVWVDDKYAGQSPLSLKLSAGTHEIAVGEGRARERRTVRLRAGESESLTFRPPPAAR